MTREEAIETLRANYPDACFEQLREAVDVAIEALMAQDVPDMNDGDMIYRQDAIDAAKHAWAKGLEPSQYIEELPSAQPVVKDIDVPSTDTIDALDSIGSLDTEADRKYARSVLEALPSAQPDLSDYSDKLWRAAFERGKAEGKEERKTGRWIYGEDNLRTGVDGWFCSECEHFEAWDYSADMKSAELNLPNFCPNCGAAMIEEGAQDG